MEIANYKNTVLLRSAVDWGNKTRYLVVYGLSCETYTTLAEGLKAFSNSVLHAAEADGLLD